MSKTNPALSVILPVYNGAMFVDAAVRSIREQTFSDFELIIINDGSTDDSGKILAAHAAEDSRIRLVNQANQGLIKTLNLGLSLASGEYLARMDADDISVPDRFERQLKYLGSHSECVLLGSSIILIDENGNEIKKVDYITDPEKKLMSYSAIAHPSVMGKTEIFKSLGGYRNAYKHAEDYDLWLRIAEKGRLVNLPDHLLKYRIHSNSIGMRHTAKQAMMARVAVASAKLRRNGQPDPTQDIDEFTPEILRKTGLSVFETDLFILSSALDSAGDFLRGVISEDEFRSIAGNIGKGVWNRSGWRAYHDIYWRAFVFYVKSRDIRILKRFMDICGLLRLSFTQRTLSILTFPLRVFFEILKRVETII